MIKPKLLNVLAATSIFSLSALPAVAAPGSKPNGPWTTPNQEISLEAFSTYEELTERLMKIEKTSKGLVEVEEIGVSGEGRSIWLAKIGDPSKTPVLIFTQQHGDQPHGTESALELIKTLSTGSGKAGKILGELFVLIIPRVNPDGAEFPTRGNADFTAPPRNDGQCPDAGGSDPNGKGIFSVPFTFGDTTVYSYESNRYHWGDWEESWQFLCNPDGFGGSIYPVNPVPEAVAVLDTYNEYGPIWAVDIHNQGFNVVDDETCAETAVCRDGQYVTGSILWPKNPDVDPDAVNFSKQMAIVMKKRSLQLGNVELTRAAGGTFPAFSRNAYGLLGSDRLAMGETGPLGGTVLFEVAGRIDGDFNNGQKAIGKLKSGIEKVLMALLEATADGSLFLEDPNEADTLILDNDVSLGNPRGE